MYSLILTYSNDCLFSKYSNFHWCDEFSSVGFISLSHWFQRISLCYRTRLVWLNSGSFLMLIKIGQKYFIFYWETTSTHISFTYCKHISKDHRTMKTFLTSWTTESVDGHNDYYRASTKTWRVPNHKFWSTLCCSGLVILFSIFTIPN